MHKQAATGRDYITKGITTFKSKNKKETKQNRKPNYNKKKKKSNPEIERPGKKSPIVTIGNIENTLSQTTKNCDPTTEQVLQMPMSADVSDTKKSMAL